MSLDETTLLHVSVRPDDNDGYAVYLHDKPMLTCGDVTEAYRNALALANAELQKYRMLEDIVPLGTRHRWMKELLRRR